MIRTVLIDDEPAARTVLRALLARLPDAPVVVGEATNVAEGRALIERERPDLIFLDIQLEPGRTGFDLLESLPGLEAEVIFVTAYDHYAIRAFQLAAFGYLLKPVQFDELRTLVERLRDRTDTQAQARQRTQVLLDNRRGGSVRQLVVSNMNGFRILALDEIVYLRGEVNYTRFVLEGGEQIMVSKTLRSYEQLLGELGFLRIHQSYLLNLSQVSEYRRGEGGTVIMANGDELDVSRRRKKEFIACFLG